MLGWAILMVITQQKGASFWLWKAGDMFKAPKGGISLYCSNGHVYKRKTKMLSKNILKNQPHQQQQLQIHHDSDLSQQ